MLFWLRKIKKKKDKTVNQFDQGFKHQNYNHRKLMLSSREGGNCFCITKIIISCFICCFKTMKEQAAQIKQRIVCKSPIDLAASYFVLNPEALTGVNYDGYVTVHVICNSYYMRILCFFNHLFYCTSQSLFSITEKRNTFDRAQ